MQRMLVGWGPSRIALTRAFALSLTHCPPVLCPQVPGPGWALCATCHSTASPSRAGGCH